MTEVIAPLNATGPFPYRAADQRTMIGHVVVCRGSGHDGADSVAVWQVSPDGNNTGAWIVSADEAFGDQAAARRLIDSCVQRAVVGWETAESLEILRELERVAEVEPRSWEKTTVGIRAALGEVAGIRASCAERVAEEKERKKTTSSLEWGVGLPDPLPADRERLRRTAGLTTPVAACPVAVDALLTSWLVRWAVERWRETATALGRREYLLTAFGQPQLPPVWESALADAFAAR
ncbi:MAG TPA: DUF6218 family protein [Pseudonocardiaceae bacterium]|jgi:hypothetical protein|nr:DUF6218 family protein [Pseudonocardiaceae bacterium]